jgi:hypothetical protein
MPEIICVADLAVWKTAKLIIPKQPDPVDSKSDHDSIRTGYIVTSKEDESSLYTPVGAMIFDLLNRLAWDHTGLRDIVSYMRRLNVSGSGQGHLREWTWDELSFFTKRDMQRRGLSQGSFWDEWGMVQM